MTPAVAVAGLLLFAIVVAVVSDFRDKLAMAERRSRLSAREKQEVNRWFNQQFLPFEVERTLAIEVLRRLAQRLGCDLTQIHADDSFSAQLGLRPLWPMLLDGDDELTCFFEVDLLEELGSEEHVDSLADCATVAEMMQRIQRLRDRVSGRSGEA